MDKKLESIFKSIGELKSPDFLASKILARINDEQIKKATIRNIVFRFVGSFSFIALFPVIISLVSQLQNSGFWNYLSLLFTDTGTVALYWKQFSLSLIESLPLFGIITVAFLTLAVFISLRFINVNYKKYEYKF